MLVLSGPLIASQHSRFASWHDHWSLALTSFESLPAIRSSLNDISFSELDHRSLELVHALRRRLGLEDLAHLRVAIPVDRFDFLIAFLAVWRLNGVVIPFSPRVLKTHQLLSDAMEPLVHLWLDSDFEVCSHSLSMSIYASARACYEGHAIFFTSGSTGLPRAVLRGWGQALFEADQYAKVLSLSPGVTTDMLVAPYFGASTKHLLGSLLNGCSLSFPRLLQGNSNKRGRVLYATPSLLNEINTINTTNQYDWVSLTGEPVREATKRRLSDVLTLGGRCLDALGGTEFGVLTNRILEVHSGVVHASRLVEEKSIVIRDDHGFSCPPNSPGRLTVRSNFLAEGYLDVIEGEINLRRFSITESGESQFVTGDIAFTDAQGDIHLLGRASQTLKLHGRWVDSSPLDERINCYPNISEYRIDIDPNAERLRLWLNVADQPWEVFQSLFVDLETSLKSSPCLPKVIIGLNDFPRNVNGKVDLQALYESEGSGWIYELSHDLNKLAVQLVFRPNDQDLYVSENSTLADLGIKSIEIAELSVLVDRLIGRSIKLEILWLNVPINELRRLIYESRDLYQAVFSLGHSNSKDCLLWFGAGGAHKVARQIGHRVKIYYFDTEADSMYQDHNRWPTVDQCVVKVLSDSKLQNYERIFIGGYSFGALMANQAAAFLTRSNLPISGVLLLDPPPVEVPLMKTIARKLRGNIREGLELIFGETYVDPLFKQSRKRLIRKVAIARYVPLESSQKTWIVTNQKYHASTWRTFSKISSALVWIQLPIKDHLAVIGHEFQEAWLEILEQWLGQRSNL